ncbi:MAG: AAA family ATPase [Patescibacteria group bacterium]|nr:AAA family ATPase [Patescibacteria group bacterium]
MYLKRLEIHGFKSFAQKSVLEFSQGIIAVVGPNGSGKSNLADALRWVLGEQSAKMIRGKKSDDVIFAGSDKKTRLGFCEVFATFDNRDHHIPVDAAEVCIGRRIDRSGESEYLLNGNRVRLLDIIDLVLRSNIGTSRYTVIGQGTIDQIVLQGPAGVKDLVDEASGVKNYYIKRDRTLRRLEQTANNLMRAEDLIKEIEPRLKSLRRQAKKMEARAELETELKSYQRQFFAFTYGNLKGVLDDIGGKLAKLQEQRHALEQDLASRRRHLEELEANHNNNAEYRRIQEQLRQLQDKKNKLLEDLSVVRGKMQSQKAASGDPKTLQVELHQKQQAVAETADKLRAAQARQAELATHLAEENQKLQALTQKLNQLYTHTKNPAQIDWALFDLEMRSLEESFERFYAGLDAATDMAAAKTQAEFLKQSLGKFKQTVKGIVKDPQAALEAFQHDLQQVLSQKDNLSEVVRKAELEMSSAKINAEFLAKHLAQLEQERLHLDLELKKAQSHSFDEFVKGLIVEEERVKKDLDAQSAEIAHFEQALKAHFLQEEQLRREIREAEGAFRLKQDELSKLKDQESRDSVEKAKADTQMQVLLEEVRRILGSEEADGLGRHQVSSIEPGLDEKIVRLKNQLEMIGGMDELTLKEYQETEARYGNLSGQVEDLKKSMGDLKNIMDELDGHIKSKFDESFHKVNEKFEFYFRLLFNGGRAYLSALKADEKDVEEIAAENPDADVEEPAGEQLRPEEKLLKKYSQPASNIIGIDIKATPPGKKLSSIQALSGGERALTSIALLCSLLSCFPSPFVVLDEVDAALDEANTIRFGQILGTLAHQTQFITITHNRETMAQSTMLYGVTMGDDGVSKLLSIKLDQAALYAK